MASVFSDWLWRGDPPVRYGGNAGRDTFMANDPDHAYSQWQITYASEISRVDRFPFKRFPDGWRYGPLSGTDVEQLLALIDLATGEPSAAAPASR